MRSSIYRKVSLGLALSLGLLTNVQAYEYTHADIEIAAQDYSGISSASRWFARPDGALYTAWGNQWLEFDAYLVPGQWNVGINAINQGNLGSHWYNEFRVLNNLTNQVLNIEASDSEVHSDYLTIDVAQAALYSVRYTWLNDAYNPGAGLDANIQINNAFFDNLATNPSAVPLPATWVLMLFGLLGLGLHSRRT